MNLRKFLYFSKYYCYWYTLINGGTCTLEENYYSCSPIIVYGLVIFRSSVLPPHSFRSSSTAHSMFRDIAKLYNYKPKPTTQPNPTVSSGTSYRLVKKQVNQIHTTRRSRQLAIASTRTSCYPVNKPAHNPQPNPTQTQHKKMLRPPFEKLNNYKLTFCEVIY